MKRIYGINSDCIKGHDQVDTLKIIKDAGFTNFFTNECDQEKVKRLKAKADELGLCFEFLHAPFRGVNAMWEEGDGYLDIYNGMINAINSASANGISTIIIHTSSGWTPPLLNDIGFSRYDALVDYAKEKNVIIAFENLRSLSHVAFVVDRYKNNDNVRYCYDYGHAHCYTPNVEWIKIFNDKIIATHIHDNHGYIDDVIDGDEHLLPYDGNINYKQIKKALKICAYKGSYMLELTNSAKEEYKNLTPEEFIKTAYKRLKKLTK